MIAGCVLSKDEVDVVEGEIEIVRKRSRRRIERAMKACHNLYRTFLPTRSVSLYMGHYVEKKWRTNVLAFLL
jgi:hypothetical protein